MNHDWVKIRSDLYRHPKVIIMADELMSSTGKLAMHVNQYCQCNMAVTRNVMRNAVVGALASVWGVLRHRGKRDSDDLVVEGATLSVIDDVADLPGFGAAMAAVGWAKPVKGTGFLFPDFFKNYNVDPDESYRLKNAERQRRFREKNKGSEDNVTVTPPSNAVTGQSKRERKSKREKEETLVAPATVKVRNHLFMAIAELSGLDPATAGGLIGKVSASLSKANPPYTAADVAEFGRRFPEFCSYAAEKGRTRPTPGEIEKNIGLLRARPIIGQKPAANGYGTRAEREISFATKMAIDAFIPEDRQ